MDNPMKEAEVSLRVAIYYITNNLTSEDVIVSLDGAHIKTKDTVHFKIFDFMKAQRFNKVNDDYTRWQGEYINERYGQKIVVIAKSGVGDIKITLNDGKTLFVESKKGVNKKGNPEYPLLREAIGQLVTNENYSEKIVSAVAVPYCDKTYSLAEKWSKLAPMKMLGIQFILVKKDGTIVYVK